MPRRPMEVPQKPTRTSPTTQLAIRIPWKLFDRLSALVERVSADPPAGATRVTRSVVLRLALERGVAALEAEYGVAGSEGA